MSIDGRHTPCSMVNKRKRMADRGLRTRLGVAGDNFGSDETRRAASQGRAGRGQHTTSRRGWKGPSSRRHWHESRQDWAKWQANLGHLMALVPLPLRPPGLALAQRITCVDCRAAPLASICERKNHSSTLCASTTLPHSPRLLRDLKPLPLIPRLLLLCCDTRFPSSSGCSLSLILHSLQLHSFQQPPACLSSSGLHSPHTTTTTFSSTTTLLGAYFSTIFWLPRHAP
jgi:hypothetical protein